jgi:anti-sigma factor ChrR (cupin superfamily)
VTRDDRDALAAEYALGTLDAAARVEVARRLESDLELRGLVEAWERRLAPLAESLGAEAPSDDLFARIEADLEQVLEGTVTIRAEAGEWQPLAEGVQIKVLSIDRAAGQRSCLVRMAPGSRFDPHNHTRNEECLILEGDLRFGDLWLRAGDYHVARAGVPHPVAVSRGGCLLFISGGL